MSLKTPADIVQTDPPRPPRETLPTMYDLPSEDPEEPGLPDEFHYHQPALLQETFKPPTYPPQQFFATGDMNVYYDVHHPLWHKRPDWFAVLDVHRFYEQRDARLSYVVWQEGIMPHIVVELLSPSTEKEDLGQSLRDINDINQPPSKWQVYQNILHIPYYVVYDHRREDLKVFMLAGDTYEQQAKSKRGFWFPKAQLYLGLWTGEYRHWSRQWLRWYDINGQLIATPAEQTEQVKYQAEREKQRAEQAAQQAEQEKQRAEQAVQQAEQATQQAEQEKQRAEQERQRADLMAQRLRELGVDPDDL